MKNSIKNFFSNLIFVLAVIGYFIPTMLLAYLLYYMIVNKVAIF
jgi:hypothetical protein